VSHFQRDTNCEASCTVTTSHLFTRVDHDTRNERCLGRSATSPSPVLSHRRMRNLCLLPDRPGTKASGGTPISHGPVPADTAIQTLAYPLVLQTF